MAADSRRPPPWRDVRYLTWGFQAAIVAAIIAFVLWLRKNLSDNGWDLNFGFLDRQAAFPIADSDFRPTQSVWDALKEGIANTGRLIVSGILLATLFGTLIGIARLSQNFILRTAAQWYVEFVRNVPLVAIFVLMYSSVALTYLPHPRDPLDWSPVLVANTRGVAIPWYEASNSRFAILVAAVLIAFIVAFTVSTANPRPDRCRGSRRSRSLSASAWSSSSWVGWRWGWASPLRPSPDRDPSTGSR